MKDMKTKKGNKKIVIALLAIVVCLVLPFSVLSSLWVEDVPAFQTTPTLEIVEKVRKAEKQGSTVELNNSELNSIIQLYTASKLRSMPMFNGINARVSDSKIELFVDGIYKDRVKFLLYAQGELDYREGNIIYTPQEFKIGRIPVPKRIVWNQLRNIDYQGMTVHDEYIEVSKDLIPLEITSISVADDKIILDLKKPAEKQEKPENSETDVKDETESQVSTKPNNESEEKPVEQPTAEKPTAEKPAPESPEPPDSSPQQSVEDETKKDLLIDVNSQLAAVHSKVKTENEKAIISTMISTVNNLINDLSSPYQNQAQIVLGEYAKLTSEEKTDLKQVMLTNMDIQTAIEVKNLFGL